MGRARADAEGESHVRRAHRPRGTRQGEDHARSARPTRGDARALRERRRRAGRVSRPARRDSGSRPPRTPTVEKAQRKTAAERLDQTGTGQTDAGLAHLKGSPTRRPRCENEEQRRRSDGTDRNSLCAPVRPSRTQHSATARPGAGGREASRNAGPRRAHHTHAASTPAKRTPVLSTPNRRVPRRPRRRDTTER